MLLKRKRSESELSMTSTVSSAFSSPPRPDSSIFSFSSPSPFAQPSLFSSSSCRAPAHLHSRTLKRFRDNRPSEAEVHQHTLDLLYSGAAAPQQHQQPAIPETSEMAPPAPTPATRTQRSLHSFWNIPGSAPAPPSSSIAASSSQAMQHASSTSCEDCGVGLGGGSATAAYDDDGAMEVDGEGGGGGGRRAAEGRSCSACGKAVCFSCSVSNLGEQARCLACAGRKVWVGGTGWTGVC